MLKENFTFDECAKVISRVTGKDFVPGKIGVWKQRGYLPYLETAGISFSQLQQLVLQVELTDLVPHTAFAGAIVARFRPSLIEHRAKLENTGELWLGIAHFSNGTFGWATQPNFKGLGMRGSGVWRNRFKITESGDLQEEIDPKAQTTKLGRYAVTFSTENSKSEWIHPIYRRESPTKIVSLEMYALIRRVEDAVRELFTDEAK